jgi:hypothetical protein
MAFRDISVRLACLAATCLLSAGCMTPRDMARSRAANEFHCPEDSVFLIERPSLSSGTYDVQACGHAARYTCVVSGRYGPSVCTREPYP